MIMMIVPLIILNMIKNNHVGDYVKDLSATNGWFTIFHDPPQPEFSYLIICIQPFHSSEHAVMQYWAIVPPNPL